MIWRVAYRFLRNIEDARDVTQEVLLKLHRHLPFTTGQVNVEAWLYRVTANAALNAQRTAARRARLEEAVAGCAESAARDEHPELAEAIEAEIRSLPRQQRAVVTLRIVEGLTFPEIARSFGVSEGTVKVHFARGLKKLRASLADWR